MDQQRFAQRLGGVVEELSSFDSFSSVCHSHMAGEPMPSVRRLQEFVDIARDVLFPGYFGDTSLTFTTVKYHIGVNTEKLFDILSEQILAGLCFACENKGDLELPLMRSKAQEIAIKFIEILPSVRAVLVTDVQAAYCGDPAAQSYGEVIFCYPAIRAITNYRIAHALVGLGVPLIPRIIGEMAHSETGIDIHPNAQIGEYFTIDHGTGVVIGATAIIGNNVKLFQGVTLGAKSFPVDADGNPIKGIPRHPILEDNVIIYSNATILGRITIGEGSVIGGNVWVTNSVPPQSRIVQTRVKENLYLDGGGI